MMWLGDVIAGTRQPRGRAPRVSLFWQGAMSGAGSGKK
jgi:hypothetical protein